MSARPDYTRIPNALRQLAEAFGPDLRRYATTFRQGSFQIHFTYCKARVADAVLRTGECGEVDLGSTALETVARLVGPFALQVLCADHHFAQNARGLDGGHFVYWPSRTADLFEYAKSSKGRDRPPGHDGQVLRRIHRAQEILLNVEFDTTLIRKHREVRVGGPLVHDTQTKVSASEVRRTIGEGRILGLNPVLWTDATRGRSFALVDDRAFGLRDEIAFAMYVGLQLRFRRQRDFDVDLFQFLRGAGALNEARRLETPGRWLQRVVRGLEALRSMSLIDEFEIDPKARRLRARRRSDLPAVGGKSASERGEHRSETGGALQHTDRQPAGSTEDSRQGIRSQQGNTARPAGAGRAVPPADGRPREPEEPG